MSELFARVNASTKSDGIDTVEVGYAPDPHQTGLWPETPKIEAPPGYRVLARKYRPVTFEQLIGQEAMVRTLTNAIAAARLPHAWMLTGVRGIGKTTTARIIARALNCTGLDGKGGPTIHPCGKCDSCRTIVEDRNVDVLEMDAASRTSVDDIRDIIDGVRYGPVSARYKIYILDEVHMLSKNAFNALLKTLEEPPPHTKFIFATTEIRKVPVTVLSRCQRFDLHRIDSEMLAKHFADVVNWERVTAEPEAIKLIAHAADGSVRDGLSLLDQAIARGNGHVTAGDVKDMLGLADRAHSMTLCRQLMCGDMNVALETFTRMQRAGSDSVQVLQDLCDLVHMLTRGQVVRDFVHDPALPEYDRQFLTDLADIKIPALARAWQILLKGIQEVQGAPHPAQAAEMVLIRLAYAAELPTPGDLIKQLREAPGKEGVAATLSSGHFGGPVSHAKLASGRLATVTSAVAKEDVPQANTAPEETRIVPMIPSCFTEVVALFAAHREGALHAQLYSNVNPIKCEPGHLEIRVGDDAPPHLAARLMQCLSTWTGRRWMVTISTSEGGPTLAETDRRVDQARQDKARAHPLMQAVITAFPDAKMMSLRQRTVAVVPTTSDDVGAIDMPIETTEPED